MYVDKDLARRGVVKATSHATSPVTSNTSLQSPFSERRGTFFDAALDFRDPEGAALINEVKEIIAPLKGTTRKQRPVDAENEATILRKILANAVCCMFHRQSRLVAYYRKADGYDRSRSWLSGRSMGRTVDLLTSAGLLDSSVGEHGIAASTFQITLKLFKLTAAHDVSDFSLTYRLPASQLVRLRSSPPERRQMPYAPTDDTRTWTALLEAYNSFYRQHDVSLGMSEAEIKDWASHRSHKFAGGGAPLRRPEWFKSDLYRQFNNGSFDQGGRMYGGWWMYVPKRFRERIIINGQPTVELDFSGCAIRMLYQGRGIDYQDDPYYLPQIAAYEHEQGLPAGHFREAIKRMVQALINDQSGGKPEKIKLPDGITFHPAFTRAEVRRMIEEKHSDIADKFATGYGLHLQRLDSDIAISVINNLRKNNILSLPVHDSFIVDIKHRDILYKYMLSCYNNIIGMHPIIK